MSHFIAPGIFIGFWFFHLWLMEYSPWRSRSLSRHMETQRRKWIEVMARRDMRMVDTNIINGLQNGTGFFASTSLLAIGASFTLLNSGDMLLAVSEQLPFLMAANQISFEIKALGLLMIYAYAFLKFGWTYRLFNYTSILIGAVPVKDDAPQASIGAAVKTAADMSIMAAREFNRGQRAFFVAIAYLGWFFGDIVFITATIVIYTTIIFRQFFSPAHHSLAA